MHAARSSASLRIVLLAGGDSAERDISLQSGKAVDAALVAAGHKVTPVDPSTRSLASVDWSRFDACFLTLHGGAGEDGRIQQSLESLGVPYTGSAPQACRWAMSKRAAKKRFADLGVPTPAWLTIDESTSMSSVALRAEELGYPLVIKPDSAGSSLGVSIVDVPAELEQGIAAARRYDEVVIAEPLIRGREFSVALVDDRPLPMVEIVTPERIFSYEVKYHASAVELNFDFGLSPSRRSAAMQAAVAAARALGTAGLARVDLMIDRRGNAWVLEVNAIPGMTEHSLAPLAAAQAGYDMPTLCNLLLDRCLSMSSVS